MRWISALSSACILLVAAMCVALKATTLAFALFVVGSFTAVPFASQFSAKDYRALFIIAGCWMVGIWTFGYFWGGLAAMSLAVVPWSVNYLTTWLRHR